MPYTVIVQPGAINEAHDAWDWYEERQPDLGVSFLEQLAIVYCKPEINLETFSWVNEQYRQASLSGFPYVVFYETIDYTVYVDAIFHTSRKPLDRYL